METRPLSKDKRWRLLDIVERAEIEAHSRRMGDYTT
jgi:hypothetical protein